MNKKHILFGGITVLALLLAACGPTDNTTATSVSGTDLTAVGTSASTEVSQTTTEPTMESTAMGTAEATTMPEGTATANEPVLIRASDLIGLNIVGTSDVNFGSVSEVLVDQNGMVKFILIDANDLFAEGTTMPEATSGAGDTSGTGTGNATAVATSDTSGTGSNATAVATSSTSGNTSGNAGGAGMNAMCATQSTSGTGTTGTGSTDTSGNTSTTVQGEDQMVAVPFEMFDIQAGSENLVYCGTAEELRAMTPIDMTIFDNDDDFVVGDETVGANGSTGAATSVATSDNSTSGTSTVATEAPSTNGTTTPNTGMSQYEGLIRVSEYTDFDLRNADNEDLGNVEDLVIDLHQGQVQHTIVNFGGFLGIGDTTVAVPWGGLQLVIPATTETNDGQPYFLLDVPKETLEQAPTIDNLDETLPQWPGTINPNWNTETDSFWSTAGI